MTRRKKPKTNEPQKTDSPAVRRKKARRLRMIVQRHIESSEDFPIAVLHHRWGRYVMDDRSGLFTKFHGKAASIDGESVVAAWSTFDKS